jgi:hypothetical protein
LTLISALPSLLKLKECVQMLMKAHQQTTNLGLS